MIECKHFTPDHPDFAAECAKSIPIGRIHKEAFPRTTIWEGKSPAKLKLRRGDNDKL